MLTLIGIKYKVEKLSHNHGVILNSVVFLPQNQEAYIDKGTRNGVRVCVAPCVRVQESVSDQALCLTSWVTTC